jgi:hypothetical protein
MNVVKSVMQRAMPVKQSSDNVVIDEVFASGLGFVLYNPKHSELCSISRMASSGRAFAQ